MSLQGHLNSLAEKHEYLDQQLSVENSRPRPDTARVSKLKKEKLRLKEEMTRFGH